MVKLEKWIMKMKSSNAFLFLSLPLILMSCREIMTERLDWLFSSERYRIVNIFDNGKFCVTTDGTKEFEVGDELPVKLPDDDNERVIIYEAMDSLIWKDTGEPVEEEMLPFIMAGQEFGSKKILNCKNKQYQVIKKLDDKTYLIPIKKSDVGRLFSTSVSGDPELVKAVSNHPDKPKEVIRFLEISLGLEEGQLSESPALGLALRFHAGLETAEVAFVSRFTREILGRRILMKYHVDKNDRGRTVYIFSGVNCEGFDFIEDVSLDLSWKLSGLEDLSYPRSSCRMVADDVPKMLEMVKFAEKYSSLSKEENLSELDKKNVERAKTLRQYFGRSGGFDFKVLSEGPKEPVLAGIPFGNAFIPDLADTLIEKTE